MFSRIVSGLGALLAFVALLVPWTLGVVPADAGGLILPKDLEYLGGFRMPNDVSSGQDWASGGSGLTYCPTGDPNGPNDGFPGSLYGVGKTQVVSEVSIPRPILPSGGPDPGELNHGTTLQPFADVTGGLRGAIGVDKLGGVAYLPAQAGQTSGKLYWTIYEYYNAAGENYLSHGMSELSLSNPNPKGVWRLGSASDDDFNSMKTADYIFDIPARWAAEHVGGKRLASGRHRENGAFGGCQGPAIYAFAPWQQGTPANGAELDAVCLLRYPTGGHYFPDYCAADYWTGGVWMDYEGRGAVLIVGSKGMGPQFYGQGDGSRCSSAKGFHCDPYEAQFLFYNPDDLAAVARGERQPWQVLPFATVVPGDLWPQCRTRPASAAFDAGRGILYVAQYNAAQIPDGVGPRIPVVHVWRVRPRLTRETAQAFRDDSGITGGAGANEARERPEVAARAAAVALADPDGVTISPNPFQGSTVIELPAGLAGSGAQVTVYDLSGRLVEDLGAPTSESVRWDASGRGPGLYFVRVSAGGASITKKVSLVR